MRLSEAAVVRQHMHGISDASLRRMGLRRRSQYGLERVSSDRLRPMSRVLWVLDSD